MFLKITPFNDLLNGTVSFLFSKKIKTLSAPTPPPWGVYKNDGHSNIMIYPPLDDFMSSIDRWSYYGAPIVI